MTLPTLSLSHCRGRDANSSHAGYSEGPEALSLAALGGGIDADSEWAEGGLPHWRLPPTGVQAGLGVNR